MGADSVIGYQGGYMKFKAVVRLEVLLLWLSAVAANAASVIVTPSTTSAPTGGARTFSATVIGVAGGVVWDVDGIPGGDIHVGTVTQTGVYKAPASIATAPTLVTLTARSQVDPMLTGSAIITVRHPIPWITGVTPSILQTGTFTVDVLGSRFIEGAQVFLNGVGLATIRIDATHLTASGVLAPDQIGALTLRVENPGGVASSPYIQLVGISGGGGADPQTVAAVRFLEHASFGPTPNEVDRVKSIGIDAWLQEQLSMAESPIPDGLDVFQVQSHVFRAMAAAPDTLRQRMVFALSQLFVVSANKNVNGEELIPWMRLLSRNAFGNFRTLLREVTLSPTMGKYLDLANSMKPSGTNQAGANENYARELMQLFSIGLYELNQDGTPVLNALGDPVPAYDQSGVRNLALALTGWTYPTAPNTTPRLNNNQYFVGWMEPRDASHDKSAKTLLNGQVLPADLDVVTELDQALDNLFQHQNVPPFIATRLIRALVTSNPSPAYIKRVSDVFVDNGQGVRGDLAAVLVAILTDVEVRQDDPPPEQGRLKDPVNHILSLVRALEGQVNDPSQFLYVFESLGERVLASPTVFSFYSPLAGLPGEPTLYGPEFQIYTPALAIHRANLIYGILNGQFGNALSVDLTPFIAIAGDPSALAGLIDGALFYGRMSPLLRQTLINASEVVSDPRQRAIGALFIAAISSEYAVSR